VENNDTERDGVPEDYPGRIARFPEGTDKLVVTVLGAQGPDLAAQSDFIENCRRLADLENGPGRLERGQTIDAAGVPASLLLAYWTDPAAAQTWWACDEVAGYWRALPVDQPTGYFYEQMVIPFDRFNYAAGTEDRHGSAAVLPLEASTTFGYWGAYRDRLAASKHDPFDSDLTAVPTPLAKETTGRRLSVQIPNNLCYIREGQGWGKCGPEERQIWDEQMNSVIDGWVARLASDPVATGCLSIRDCKEHDAAASEPIERRTQIAFLLSLSHIEQAARTDPAHLAVHGAFVKMYTEPQFTPQMHVWVEIGVMKRDEVTTEYVNCHPMTGLLPYFDITDVE
jgi:hypothetical protein